MSDFSLISTDLINVWTSSQSAVTPVQMTYIKWDDWKIEDINTDYALLTPVSYSSVKSARGTYNTEYVFAIRYISVDETSDEVPSAVEEFEMALLRNPILPSTKTVFRMFELTSPTRFNGSEGLAGIYDSGILEAEGLKVTSGLIYIDKNGML